NIARSICEDAGGSLPIVRTAADNETIARLLATVAGTSESRTCWLGASDVENEGDFRWLDGSPVAPPNFINWGSGQPDNKDGGENYLLLRANMESGQLKTSWEDARSNRDLGPRDLAPFICEWER